MTIAATPEAPGVLERAAPPREDHFVSFAGATWADYERLDALRDEKSVPRITFLGGLLELMSPSTSHEWLESTIGRLVEVYCLERDIDFSTYGSWTIKDKRKECGAEPDECYVFGPGTTERSSLIRPDLAIEVIWTSGGLDKLEVYRRLAVPEVWVWRKGRIEVFGLRDGAYAPVAASAFVAGIDLALLASFIDRPTTSEAIRAYRSALPAR